MNIKEIMQPYYDKLASMERLKNNVDSNNNKVVELDESMEVLNSKLDVLNSVEISLNKEKAVEKTVEGELLNNFVEELNNIKSEQNKKVENFKKEISAELEEKQQEILAKLEEKQQEIGMLRNRLERLKDNKEAELNSFFAEYNPDLFANYGGTVRKDLEDAYLKNEQTLNEQITQKEQELIELKKGQELKELKKARTNDLKEFIKARELELQITIEERKFEIEDIISNKTHEKENLNLDSNVILGDLERFHRVDVRELIDIKMEANKKLLALKNMLELELRERQLKADSASLELAKYNKNANKTTEEWKMLFEKSSELLDKVHEIRLSIREVEKYIELVQVTNDEWKIAAIAMNQLEKDEMDRRKGIEREVPSVEFEYNNMETIEREEESKEFDYSELADSEQEKVNEAASEFEYNNMEEKAEEESKEFDYSELEVPENDPANVEFDKVEESTPIAEKKEALNSATDLITTIYRDIVTSVKEVNTLEYEGKIPLPNGKYLNNEDIMKATNNYFSRMKGRTLKVEATNKEFVVNKSVVRRIKKALKHSAISILIGEGKIGEPDLKRVYGLSGIDTYDLGRKRTDLPSGYYTHVDFYLDLLKQVFVEKKETWLDRFVSKRQAKKAETIVTNNDFVEEQESVKTR